MTTRTAGESPVCNRLKNPIRQIGIVVKDVDAAMRHWIDVVGVGPFVALRKLEFDDDYRYRGASAKPPVATLALGFSGALQIELIEQHNDAPSAYRDYLAAGHEGMQHVSPWYASCEEYDAGYAQLLEGGLEVIHQGRLKGATVRFAYFASPRGGWPHYEISEALHPSIKPLIDRIAQLNAAWDGRTPGIIDVTDMADLGRLLGMDQAG